MERTVVEGQTVAGAVVEQTVVEAPGSWVVFSSCVLENEVALGTFAGNEGSSGVLLAVVVAAAAVVEK